MPALSHPMWYTGEVHNQAALPFALSLFLLKNLWYFTMAGVTNSPVIVAARCKEAGMSFNLWSRCSEHKKRNITGEKAVLPLFVVAKAVPWKKWWGSHSITHFSFWFCGTFLPCWHATIPHPQQMKQCCVLKPSQNTCVAKASRNFEKWSTMVPAFSYRFKKFKCFACTCKSFCVPHQCLKQKPNQDGWRKAVSIDGQWDATTGLKRQVCQILSKIWFVISPCSRKQSKASVFLAVKGIGMLPRHLISCQEGGTLDFLARKGFSQLVQVCTVLEHGFFSLEWRIETH